MRIEERLDRLKRRSGLAELVEPECGDAGPRTACLVRTQAGKPRAEKRDELTMFALALVEALEAARKLGIARLELLKLLEVADRAVRTIGEVFRSLRSVFEQVRALLSRRRRERAVVEDEEIVPPLGGVEDELESVERPVGRRVELEDALENEDDAGRVLEPLLVELDGALAHRHRLLLRKCAREHLFVERRDVVGSRKRARQLLGTVPERVDLRQLAGRTRRRGERVFVAAAFALQVAQTLEPHRRRPSARPPRPSAPR